MSIRKLQKTDYNKKYLELLNQLKPIIRYDQEIFNNIFEDISNDIMGGSSSEENKKSRKHKPILSESSVDDSDS